MGRNEDPEIARIEDELAMVNEADEAQQVLAMRTRRPEDIAEIRRTRAELAKLRKSLIEQRQALQRKYR